MSDHLNSGRVRQPKGVVPSERKPKTKSKGFRISARKLFLTYSQVCEDITPDLMFDLLCEKITFKQYIIAKEKHQDQEIDFHVILVAFYKFDIRSEDALDIAVLSIRYNLKRSLSISPSRWKIVNLFQEYRNRSNKNCNPRSSW